MFKLSTLSALILILLCTAAAFGRTAYLPSGYEAPVSSTFQIPVYIDDAESIFCYDMTISYDPAIVQPVGGRGNNFGCSTAGTIAEAFTVNCNVLEAGQLLISAYSGYELPAIDGDVLTVEFEAVDPGLVGKQTQLNFENAIFYTIADMGPTPVTPSDGYLLLVE